MNKKLALLFTFVALFGLARVYYYLTDDFRLANMTYELPHSEAWETDLPTLAQKEELTKILNQNFTYLGKGAQVYAFGSEDGNYVIKFFKFKHIRPSALYDFIPSVSFFKDYKTKKNARKKRKVNEIFNGYKVAYEHDRENTGLIYLHLNKTTSLNLKASIIDKIGLKYVLDLDSTVFILQKKGETLRDRLKALLVDHDIEGIKSSLSGILDMYLEEYQKGIFDHDHGVTQNSGFTGITPFHLDVGKFFYSEEYKEPSFYEKDLTWVALKMKEWLLKHAPSHASTFDLFLTNYLSEKFNRPVNLENDQKLLEMKVGHI